MIPINEIRVGIWTHNNVEKRRLTKEDVSFLMTGDNAHYAYPIPLTEETLLKAGFEKTDFPDTKEYVKGDFIVYMYNPVNREVYFGMWDVKLKYVHELQNLWHAVTKKELEINL